MDIKQKAKIRYEGGGQGWVWTSKGGFNYYNYRTEEEAVKDAKEMFVD